MTNPFEDLGFTPTLEKRSPRPAKAFAREYTKGALGSYGDILDITVKQPKESLLPGQKALLEAESKVPEHMKPYFTSDEDIPHYSRVSSSKDVEELLNQLGIEREEEGDLEKGLGRTGRILGSSNVLGAKNILGSIFGGIGGQVAEILGFGEGGQAVGEIAGMIGPQGLKGLYKMLTASPDKMTSGLTKLSAVDAKNSKRAFISKERQKETISKLNQEASDLAKEVFHKEVPIAKKIEQGFDFEKDFQKRFSQVKEIAEKANPYINTKPLANFFRSTIDRYKGVPNLHTDAKKALQEIRAYTRNPQNGLGNLLKIYRSNNQKVKGIYDTSRLTGKQQEYVDFLNDYNRSIRQSIKETLPDDSQFVKMMESSNKDYGNYLKALQTEKQLSPILGKNITPAKIAKLADDEKAFSKLSLSMGESGANEIRQIARDLKTSREAIKNIPAKDLNKWNSIWPLATLLPAELSIPIIAAKVYQTGKYGYGILLSSPAKRAAYSEALQSINSGNYPAYVQAAKKLSMELGEEFKEPDNKYESLGFTPKK